MKKVEDGKVRLIFKLNSRLIDFHIKKNETNTTHKGL